MQDASDIPENLDFFLAAKASSTGLGIEFLRCPQHEAKGVFEPRKATGSGMFSLLVCFFNPIFQANGPYKSNTNQWSRQPKGKENISFPVSSMAQKLRSLSSLAFRSHHI